jgi:hypothetical protein|tara:strand:- start:14923 stop:15102 length:180 start_codon:yes stop_codon:yes gene_type:complete
MNDTIAKIKDSIEITAVNGGAVMLSTMAEVEQGLRMLSLVLAVAYTSVRMYQLLIKGKE